MLLQVMGGWFNQAASLLSLQETNGPVFWDKEVAEESLWALLLVPDASVLFNSAVEHVPIFQSDREPFVNLSDLERSEIVLSLP